MIATIPSWSRALAGALLIAACVLVFPRGGLWAVVVVFLSALVATSLASGVARGLDRRVVIGGVLLAILGRDVLVGAIDTALLVNGERWYAGDEATWIGTGVAIWRHWVDPSSPFDYAYPYNSSQYVQSIARVFLLVGENVVVVKLLNTLVAVLAAILAYRTMRNLGTGGARWALLLLLVFPSITLWTALALKDAYVMFFLVASLWTSSEFVRSRNPVWLVATVAALVPIESVRPYMFVTAALAWLALPLGMSRWKDRLLTGAAVLATVILLFALFDPFRTMGPNLPWIPIYVRSAVAQGAGSSFVEPAPIVRGQPGEQFVITVSGVTPAPNTTPRVIIVRPGAEILVERSASAPDRTASPAAGPNQVTVRPGDILVIASSVTPAPESPVAGATQTATPPPHQVALNPEAKNTVGLSTEVDPDQASVEGSVVTNLAHLPLGIAYTLFAPFPWSARTLEQFATIPEMILWYACLVAALVGALRLLSRWDLRFAHGFALVMGIMLILSLIGANTGTLLRTRAMLVPFVLMLTAVGIDDLLRRFHRLAPGG